MYKQNYYYQDQENYSNDSEEPNQNHKKLILKILSYIGYAILGFVIFWILLNLFISPINRILGLPRVDNLNNTNLLSSIQIYDKNGDFVSSLQGKEDREIISLDEVSTSLKQALLASEDRAFYKHGGINFFSIFRACLINLKSGRIVQGGSTLTQQLVKNLFFSLKDWKTSGRKIKELFLTLEIERKYNKDQILELYLNSVFWGKNSYGVQRASQRYFGKDARELNIAESAYLVSLLSSPSTLHQTERAYIIQKKIISDMAHFGYISREQAEYAKNYKLEFKSAPLNFSKYPFYMSAVLEDLKSRYSENDLSTGGLKIYTSLDQEAQENAEKILGDGIKSAPRGINQGALVTIDVQSGEVRAIVGGVGNFWDNQWNRALSPHTLGSSFKPFVYLTAFMKGAYSAESTISDSPFSYFQEDLGTTWEPKNFDNEFWGDITVRRALIYSRNIPAVRVAKKVGINSVIETSQAVGLKNIQPYLASALGSSAESPLTMANAYATLARGGIYIKPIIIQKIVDSNGKVIEETKVETKRVLPANPIYELISILIDVVNQGTGVMAKIPDYEIAGKTGTADGSRDVWFAGFTPDVVTVIWGGNDKNKEASSYATGGGVLASIWKKYMIEYFKTNPATLKYFPRPAQRVRRLIDPITGLLATKSSFRPEYRDFVKGTEPTEYAPKPTQEDIDKYLKENAKTAANLDDEEEEDNEDEEIVEEPSAQEVQITNRRFKNIKQENVNVHENIYRMPNEQQQNYKIYDSQPSNPQPEVIPEPRPVYRETPYERTRLSPRQRVKRFFGREREETAPPLEERRSPYE